VVCAALRWNTVEPTAPTTLRPQATNTHLAGSDQAAPWVPQSKGADDSGGPHPAGEPISAVAPDDDNETRSRKPQKGFFVLVFNLLREVLPTLDASPRCRDDAAHAVGRDMVDKLLSVGL
jgi:hypothetical protein